MRSLLIGIHFASISMVQPQQGSAPPLGHRRSRSGSGAGQCAGSSRKCSTSSSAVPELAQIGRPRSPDGQEIRSTGSTGTQRCRRAKKCVRPWLAHGGLGTMSQPIQCAYIGLWRGGRCAPLRTPTVRGRCPQTAVAGALMAVCRTANVADSTHRTAARADHPV